MRLVAILALGILLAGCLDSLETPEPQPRELTAEDATPPASEPAPVEESMQTPAIQENMTGPAAVGEWINGSLLEARLATVDNTDPEHPLLHFEFAYPNGSAGLRVNIYAGDRAKWGELSNGETTFAFEPRNLRPGATAIITVSEITGTSSSPDGSTATVSAPAADATAYEWTIN